MTFRQVPTAEKAAFEEAPRKPLIPLDWREGKKRQFRRQPWAGFLASMAPRRGPFARTRGLGSRARPAPETQRCLSRVNTHPLERGLKIRCGDRKIHAGGAGNYRRSATLAAIADPGPSARVDGCVASPVPIDTAIAYARQIAMEAAHEKEVIHRDLKAGQYQSHARRHREAPGFRTRQGHRAEGAAASTRRRPTLRPRCRSPCIQARMILGTPAYMVPERARGKAVDRGADIWAFGVVLFEMRTDKMPFGGGETVSDSLAAVLTGEPDFHVLPEGHSDARVAWTTISHP